MIRLCQQIELAHHRFIQFTEFSHFGNAHVGVADDVRSLKADLLPFSRRLNPLSDRCRALSQPVAAEVLLVYTRDFDLDVDTVEHGAGDAFSYLVEVAGAQVQALTGLLA